MPVEVVQFVAIRLTVPALVSGGTYLIELRNKMALDRASVAAGTGTVLSRRALCEA